MSKKNPEDGAAPERTASETPALPANTKRRAASVVRSLGLAPAVAAAVLVELGVKATDMVDPAVVAAKTAAWLKAPANN